MTKKPSRLARPLRGSQEFWEKEFYKESRENANISKERDAGRARRGDHPQPLSGVIGRCREKMSECRVIPVMMEGRKAK